MYKVIKGFTDLQDKNHVYKVNDEYPREGYAPSEGRIAELSSDKNRRRIPLIAEIVPEEAEEVSDDAELEIKNQKRKKSE